MQKALVLALFVIAACGEPPINGAMDSGPRFDSSLTDAWTNDVAVAPDTTPPQLDSGPVFDGGVGFDGGPETDSGPATDGGPQADAGPAVFVDAGPPVPCADPRMGFSGPGFLMIKDYEDGVIGDVVDTVNLGRFWSDSTYSADVVHCGRLAARSTIQAGSEGSRWGDSYTAPERIESGELWWRIYVYFPDGYDFNATPVQKFMRVNSYQSNGNGEGRIDVLLRGGGQLRVGNEVNISPFWHGNPDRENIGVMPTGQWVSMEIYLKVTSVFGEGEYRVWKDGELIFEDRVNTQNIAPGGHIGGVMYGTYWNGGSPQTQSMYVDDVIFTTQRPSRTDADGNPFIGP